MERALESTAGGKKKYRNGKMIIMVHFFHPLSSLTPVFDFSQTYVNLLNICLSHL